MKRHALFAIMAALLLSACATRPPAQQAGADAQAPVPRAVFSTDEWLGQWNGPEGSFLRLDGGGNDYLVTIRNLDGTRTFLGSRQGGAIQFERDGKLENIRHATGKETGMKWLADHGNCLIVKKGEGYCRGTAQAATPGSAPVTHDDAAAPKLREQALPEAQPAEAPPSAETKPAQQEPEALAAPAAQAAAAGGEPAAAEPSSETPASPPASGQPVGQLASDEATARGAPDDHSSDAARWLAPADAARGKGEAMQAQSAAAAVPESAQGMEPPNFLPPDVERQTAIGVGEEPNLSAAEAATYNDVAPGTVASDGNASDQLTPWSNPGSLAEDDPGF